jgi:nucleoid DNA-binding protein
MKTNNKNQMTKQEIINQIIESTNIPEHNINRIMDLIIDLTIDEQMEVFASVVQFDIKTRIWDK